VALRDVKIPISFQGGISTKESPQTTSTTKLLGLDNGRFSKMLSISKRTGHTALSQSVLGSTDPYNNVRGLAARDTELVLFTEGTSYSYVEGASAWSLIPDGVMSVRQSDDTLVKTISSQTACDFAACDGVAIVCWEDSRGGVYYAVTETAGERVIVSPRQASSTGAMPRAVRCGDRLHLLWSEAALGQIKIIAVDPTTPHSPTAAAVLVDGLVTTLANFDAAYVDEENGWERAAACITWNATDGVHVAWLDPSGVIGSPGTGWNGAYTFTPAAVVTAGPVISPSRGFAESEIWSVAWATAADAYMAVTTGVADSPIVPIAELLAPAALGIAGADRLAVASCGATSDLWIEDRAATVRNSLVRRRTVNGQTGAVSSPPQDTLRGCVLASSAWAHIPSDFDALTDTPRSFVTLLHPTPLQSTYLTVRDDALCVAQTLPGITGDASATHRLPRVTDDGDERYQWAAVFKNKLDALNNDLFTEAGPRLVTLDFDADDAYQAVTVGRSLYLGGACPMLYDGISWVEAQIHYAPDWEAGATLHTIANTGTGAIANGTFSYLFWYEATLANGEIIRGPTSKPYEVTLGGAEDSITINIPTLRLSAWGREGGTREPLRVCAARSEAGDTSLYYRVTSLDPSTAGDPNGYVENDQQADTVAFIDERNDDDLELYGDPHYTTGGVPSNAPAPSSGIVAEGKGRLFLASSSDSNAIYFSQERAEGIAIEFADLRIVTPPTGGRVTGIAAMDDAVVIFKERAIYRVVGNGPLSNPNAGGDWSLPQLVTSDVGCSDQRTICTTPMGLVFQSSKGIYQLGRDFQVSYIGANVELYNDQSLVRARLDESTREIRFLTAEGSSLLYDYGFGQWSLLTNHLGYDAVMVNGAYHYLRTDGRVFKASSEYRDDNFNIPLRIATAHIRLGEARQGFQYIRKLQVLGTWKSPHILRVSYKLDYDEDDAWTPLPDQETPLSMGGENYGDGPYGDGNYGGSTPQRYQFTFHIGRHCQSIQFLFEFIEETGVYGACAELTELLIIGGARANENKLPANRMG
jgi:hypothetical protein